MQETCYERGMPKPELQRDQEIVAYLTRAAEWDVANFSVSERFLSVMTEALVKVPLSDRDTTVGSVRYRPLGD